MSAPTLPTAPSKSQPTLTVGCDGRHAISRVAAHLPLVDEGVPIDVLWLRIARQPTDPENALGYFNYGRLIVLINRDDYFQVGYIIAKGAFPQIQQDGLAAFQQSIERIVPFLAGRTAEIDSWDKVKLLTVQVNRLQDWCSPGLLCIGDAAHAMSPVGGIGINIALQDAVATANILTESLLTGSATVHDLQSVQHYRENAVRNTQRVQVFAHRILSRVLAKHRPVHPAARASASSPASPASNTSPHASSAWVCSRSTSRKSSSTQTHDSSSQSPESPAPIPAHSRFPSPAPAKLRPSPSNPIHRAARILKICACANSATFPPSGAAAKACAITPSARSPTCSTVSPPTISFFHTDHPGICA